MARVITGDGKTSPYKSGPELVKFFNQLGFNDVYGQGFPSSWYYTETKIGELNGSPALAKAFEFDKCEFGGYCQERPAAIALDGAVLDPGGPLLEP